MANPAKRKASDDPTPERDVSDDVVADDGGADGVTAEGASADGAGPAQGAAGSPRKKVVPPKAKAKQKKAAVPAPARYTPSSPTVRRKPSPRWVPVLMFALWGIGVLLIVLNYMGVLPGTSVESNGWYLVAGLLSILGGIMVATQYH